MSLDRATALRHRATERDPSSKKIESTLMETGELALLLDHAQDKKFWPFPFRGAGKGSSYTVFCLQMITHFVPAHTGLFEELRFLPLYAIHSSKRIFKGVQRYKSGLSD